MKNLNIQYSIPNTQYRLSRKARKGFTHQNFSKKNLGGFTLVEVLVSVSLFLMAIIAISQIYIAIIRSERMAYALLSCENNIRNNLEIMARSIRLGKNFNEIPESGAEELCFDYYSDGDWKNICYAFYDNQLQKSSAGGPYVSMIDPQIKINYGRFFTKGDGSNTQKTIVIVLEASVNLRGEDYLFNLQTAITPRYLGEEI